jgi:general secretion pathway protein N
MNDASALMRTLLWWGVPFAIVVVALGYETDWGRGVAPGADKPAVASAQPVPVALLPEYRIEGGAQARKETVERVLFNPTRRPAPPATQTAGGASQMQKGLYTLTGTTVVGNVATAFLREVKGGKPRSVRKGDTLDDMLVAEVAADHVRLRQGDDVEDLQLKIAAGPKATIQTVTPPVAAAAPVPGAQPNAVAQPAAGGTRLPAAGPGALSAATPANGQSPAVRPGAASVGELLAERRRAARAAAEAAAAAAAGAAPAGRR